MSIEILVGVVIGLLAIIGVGVFFCWITLRRITTNQVFIRQQTLEDNRQIHNQIVNTVDLLAILIKTIEEKD